MHTHLYRIVHQSITKTVNHSLFLFSVLYLLFLTFCRLYVYFNYQKKKYSYFEVFVSKHVKCFKMKNKLSKFQKLHLSTSTKYETLLHHPRSKTFSKNHESWEVRAESQYSSENGNSGWPTSLKEKEEDSFIKSAMLS